MAALLVLLVIVAGGWALAYFSVPLLRWTLAGCSRRWNPVEQGVLGASRDAK